VIARAKARKALNEGEHRFGITENHSALAKNTGKRKDDNLEGRGAELGGEEGRVRSKGKNAHFAPKHQPGGTGRTWAGQPGGKKDLLIAECGMTLASGPYLYLSRVRGCRWGEEERE